MKKNGILIVDDQEEYLFLLKYVLEDEYQDLYFAKNGAEALAILKAEKVDLILTDYEMPVADGLWLLQRAAGVPTIILSASLKLEELELLKLGAKAFLPKPFSIQALLVLMEKVLNPVGTRPRGP